MDNIQNYDEFIGKKIFTAGDVVIVMKEDLKLNKEHFWVLHLNGNRELIEKELIALGTLTHVTVYTREVFRKAIRQDTCSLITVHNHLFNDSSLSRRDKIFGEKLAMAGKILDIPILDNIIIMPNGNYFSQCNQKRKERLNKSKKLKEKVK